MKSTTNTLNRGGLFVFIFLMLQSFWLCAQESQSLSKKLHISGDEMNSLYIIGGVLIFGIASYIIYSIIDKNKKVDKPRNNKPATSHRNHHHHRVVKKSA